MGQTHQQRGRGFVKRNESGGGGEREWKGEVTC